MTYEHICTVCKTSTKHISDLTAEMLHIYTPYILMEVYGIPADWDEEKIDAAIDDTVSGIPLGRVEGYLVLGAAIERSGEDLYECCDSTSEELENAVSALMEKNGPLKYAMNLFHIHAYECLSGHHFFQSSSAAARAQQAGTDPARSGNDCLQRGK